MVSEKVFRRILIFIFIIVLFLLTAMIIRPIAKAIIVGLILSYVFNPLYKGVNSVVKEKNLSAFFICIVALILIILPVWFLTPVLIKQTFELYTDVQKIDLTSTLRKILPSLFSSEQFSKEFIMATNGFINKSIASLLQSLTNIILDFPVLLLQLFVVLFIFFFSLRDSDKFIDYIKSLLPLTEESEKEFLQQSKAVTNSIIYGQVVVGIIQGLLTGIGLYIFGVSNVLVLTLIAIFVSMLPLVGAWLVYLPASIGLIILGNTSRGVGLLIYGLFFVSIIDNILKPYIISKRTKIHTSLALIGMIGGLFVFGVLGLIIGPLIIAYLLIVLNFYREKKFSSLFGPGE